MNLPINQIICGDCLEVMKTFPDKSVDLVLTDPPYGTTNEDWDSTEWLKTAWNELDRVCNGNFIMMASQPFTTDLINSNRGNFKYCWVWNKEIQGNPLLAKFQPLKIHEDIVVFGKGKYFPIMENGKFRKKGGGKSKLWNVPNPYYESDKYFPKSIITFNNSNRLNLQHPTQKPIDLMAYLIKTYSNENDIILDPFLGSGTTAVAAKQLHRRYIGIEISQKYCDIAKARLGQEVLF
jgi:site-specific DNA-methyltransferase (adenine-specific)